MKKHLLALVCIFSGASLFAQDVIIDGQFLPVNNTEIRQIYDTAATQLTIPTFGDNQVWDYSASFPQETDTYTLRTMDPASSPYGSLFPDATHSTYLRTPFNSIADSLYSYFKIDTTGLYGVGIFSEKQGTWMGSQYVTLNTDFQSMPYELVMPFQVANNTPAIYDTSVTIGFLTTDIGGTNYPIRAENTKHKVLESKGFGTLTTPIGTFSEVLLGSETIYSYDTIYVEISGSYHPIDNLPPPYNGFSQPQPTPSNTIKYHFLRNNTFASTHLLLIETDTSAAAPIRYGWYTLPSDIGSIQGTVYDSLNNPISNGMMKLYREYSNFTKNDVLATTPIESDGTYRFDSIPFGFYRIAARPLGVGRAMTTYVGDEIDWQLADLVNTIGDTTGIDIHLVYEVGHVQGNKGSASGNIGRDFSVTKMGSIQAGDPVPGIDISLEQIPGGVFVSQVETDGDGNFMLDSLAAGDYELLVDIPGKLHSATYSLSINSNDSVYGLDFLVGFDSVHVAGAPVIVQIDTTTNGGATNIGEQATEVDASNTITIYPNPSTDYVKFDIDMEEAMNIEITIFDMVGRVVKSYNVSHSTQLVWDNSDLAKGAYNVTMKLDGKLFKKQILMKN